MFEKVGKVEFESTPTRIYCIFFNDGKEEQKVVSYAKKKDPHRDRGLLELVRIITLLIRSFRQFQSFLSSSIISV